MIVHQIQDLSNQPVINLLKHGLQIVDDENLIKNYHPDYADHNSNLFYLLNKGRYKKGMHSQPFKEQFSASKRKHSPSQKS